MNEDRIRSALRHLDEIPAYSELPASTAARARGRRRLVATGLASVSALVILVAGAVLLWPGIGSGDLPPPSSGGDHPRPVTSDEARILPDHLIRLRAELPDAALPLATRELVLLYRIDDKYTGLFEGILRYSCPMLAGSEPCFSTALRREINVTTGVDNSRGSDLMEVVAPENAEILYRGEPATGPIGIEAYNACSRIEVFEPYYRCVDGEPEYVVQEPERDHREVATELEDAGALEAHLPKSFSVKRVTVYPGKGNVGRGSNTYYELIQMVLAGPVDEARITFQIHRTAAAARKAYEDDRKKRGEIIVQGRNWDKEDCSGGPLRLQCYGVSGHVQLRGEASAGSFIDARRYARRLLTAARSRVAEVYSND